MPRPRSAMRKIRDVLRLTFAERLSRRQVSASLQMSLTTVNDYVRRAERAGLEWPLPEDLDEGRRAAIVAPQTWRVDPM